MQGVERTVCMLKGCDLLWKQALEIYAFSKVWYAAQILPLPRVFVGRLQMAAGSLLWKGRFER